MFESTGKQVAVACLAVLYKHVPKRVVKQKTKNFDMSIQF